MTANLTLYSENADSVAQGDASFQLQTGKASALYYLLASDAGGDVNTADVYGESRRLWAASRQR